MGTVHHEEQFKRDVLPGDPDVRRFSLEDDLPQMMRSAVMECPDDKVFNGYTYDIIEDGAGKRHYSLTVYFMDEVPKPHLNPRNLNGAPQAVLGQLLTDEEMERYGLGQSGNSMNTPRWR